MKHALFISILLFIVMVVTGQEKEIPKPVKPLYLEIGGKGYVSVNYDIILKNKHAFTSFVSLVDYSVRQSNSTSEYEMHPTPGIMYAWLKGKGSSYFEMGAGISTSAFLHKDFVWISESGEEYHNSHTNLHVVLGYRYQKPDDLLFRAGFTPLWKIGGFPLPIIGISFGYCFN